MKRDLDLIRHILLTLEADDFSQKTRYTVSTFVDDTLSADSDDSRQNSPYVQEFARVSGHINLLLDEGFIEAKFFPEFYEGYDDFIIERMTSFGHDYLDSVRDDNVWSKTKEKLGSLIDSVSLATITDVAQFCIHQMLGI